MKSRILVLLVLSSALVGCKDEGVNPPAKPPVIVREPADAVTFEGESATYSVVVDGSEPMIFQWQKNDVDISGATHASYTTHATTLEDSGSTFRCVVKNAFGTATSRAASLSVLPLTAWEQTHLPTAWAVQAIIAVHDALLVGTWGGGILRSTNRGMTWMQASGPPELDDVLSFALTPDGAISAGAEAGIFRSVDNGFSWTAVGPDSSGCSGMVWDLFANNRGEMLAGSVSCGVSYSSDRGLSWQRLTGAYESHVQAVRITEGGVFLAGTLRGVYLSTDRGTSWRVCTSGIPQTYVHHFAISAAGIIYAGGAGFIARSTNEGLQWSLTGFTAGDAWRLAFDSHGRLYAGSIGGDGVFRSTDNGQTWIAFNTGLTDKFVRSMIISDDGYMYVGTYRSGLFRRRLMN